jgi:N-acetyl-gamma-glutamyl-phosphate reductase
LYSISHKTLIRKKLLSNEQWPIINAISGVSGTGRQPTFNNSFCEVSLQSYGIFNHRHHPEIISHLKIPVIFILQLGNFNRGILATITCFLNKKLTLKYIFNVFNFAYENKSLVRIYEYDLPSIKSVVGLPFCDIGFALQDQHLILVLTEDNLLKGAAAQAIQCFNIRFGFSEILSLI